VENVQLQVKELELKTARLMVQILLSLNASSAAILLSGFVGETPTFANLVTPDKTKEIMFQG